MEKEIGSVSDRQNRNYRRLQIRMHGIYSQDGLALCINGCENDYENNAGKLRYHNVSCKTNVVAYDTLSGLKKG